MCEQYSPCVPRRRPAKVRAKIFNMLLLDCWQREYDTRPYRNFFFKLHDFEDLMDRNFNPIKDFAVIVDFLHKRKLDTVCIIGMNVSYKLELVIGFASGLFNLRRLELKFMRLPDSFFDQLLANVDHMHLQELNLEGTHLSYCALLDLRLFLIAANHLHTLIVSSCDVDQFHFGILADGVHKSSSMRRFIFNRLIGNGLTIDSEKLSHTISSLIWQNKLEQISMRQCELIAQDMETISEYLQNKCSRLRELDVSRNTIGSDGVEYLLCSIVKSNSLTHLNVSYCGLGTHGGDVIAKYLSSCFRLENLDIRYNDIGAEVMNNILTMMKKRIRELSLKLYGNIFDAKSGKILNRLLNSRVVPQESIDITVTYNDDLEEFRIIPYY